MRPLFFSRVVRMLSPNAPLCSQAGGLHAVGPEEGPVPEVLQDGAGPEEARRLRGHLHHQRLPVSNRHPPGHAGRPEPSGAH